MALVICNGPRVKETLVIDTSSRRVFLKTSAALTSAMVLPCAAADEKPIRVVVWDEQQPTQKQAYDNFIGNWIAHYLESRPGLTVKSVALNDPGQGLDGDRLDSCDVLIWWGHVRQKELKPEIGRKIVARIVDGQLGLVALHSAHWATPFVEAMKERTRRDMERQFRASGTEKVEITYAPSPQQYTVPKVDARVTPYAVQRKFPDGVTKVTVYEPYCCFPAYRPDGKPSTIKVLKPDHPIVKDVPKEFVIPHTEMYDEPFHVPEPDEVVFEERWAGGEWFRSGCVWQLGKGKVFYFRPGHETFAVYKEKPVLQILENAARWLASRTG
jgi:trehalose utilization protein